MTERPILFSAPMVRAILEGSKTQTRRVVRGVPDGFAPLPPDMNNGALLRLFSRGGLYYDDSHRDEDRRAVAIRSRYGVPGDGLWVKETWRVGAWQDDASFIAVDYLADGLARREWLEVPDGAVMERLWEQSTNDAEKVYGQRARYEWKPGESPCRVRPSIFMPRWASRITLEVTEVRVQRVQDISEEDAKVEGPVPWRVRSEEVPPTDPYRRGYAALWDSINAKRGFSWDTNPWVWAITFKRRQ